MKRMTGVFFWLVLMGLLVACSGSATGQNEDGLQVVATTTLVGDVVRVVGGAQIELTVMLPVGGDPHGFNPTPQDVTTAANADVVFVNGLELEEFLTEMLENASQEMNIVAVSEGIEANALADEHDEEGADEEHVEAEANSEEDADHEHSHGAFDPHVWWNPANVAIWADNIAEELARLDPENGALYAENAAAYQQQLTELDAWIKEQIAQIPAANRLLVTDHDSLGYLETTYGLEIAGTVFPGLSTQSDPSAQELAALSETIQAYNVPAVFVGTTVNADLAEQVANETDVQIVAIYTDSLSDTNGPTPDYLQFMRWNITTIVSALQ